MTHGQWSARIVLLGRSSLELTLRVRTAHQVHTSRRILHPLSNAHSAKLDKQHPLHTILVFHAKLARPAMMN